MLKLFPILSKQRQSVWGMARSGIHAIAGWIYDAYPPHKLYLNDQFYCSEPTSCWAIPYFLKDYKITHHNNFKLQSTEEWPAWKEGGNSLLLMIYENHDLRCFDGDWKLSQTVVGGSEHYGHVLLIRDVFNHYASHLRITPTAQKSASYIREQRGEFEKLSKGYSIDLWKHYAKEFLGETNYLPKKTVKISYNRWVVDGDYRKGLASKLGFPSNGEPYLKVSACGGGSSFDGKDYDGQASMMNVLDRWSLLTEEERANLIQNLDDEAKSLVEAIFPETLEFLKG